MSFIKEPSFDFSLVEDGIETTFRFEDVGNVPGILNEVGDTGSNEAILFNKAGESVGTSSVEFELVKQLTDGAFIAEIENIFDFGEGNTITVAGKLNVEQFEALQPAQLEIVSGEGIFDGAEGEATLTQAELNVLDVIEIDLSLTASESSLSSTEEVMPYNVEIINELKGNNGNDFSNGLGDDTLTGQGGIDVVDRSDLPFNSISVSIAGVDFDLELSEIGFNDRHTEFVSCNGESDRVIGHLCEFTFGVSESTFIGLTITGDEVDTDILIDTDSI